MIWNEDRTEVWVRQSWLGDAIECAERGRFKSIRPDLDTTTGDQAASGTATHTAIELVLDGSIAPTYPNIEAAAKHAAFDLCDTEVIVWDKLRGPAELAEQAAMCATVWLRDIYPHVPKGGRCEVEFAVSNVLTVHYDADTAKPYDVSIGLKGTADYVTDTEIWDWKNVARTGKGTNWEPWKKQRYDHQSQIYDLAATLGGFGEPFKPKRFVFGVVDKKTMKGVIVPVHRTMYHHGWVLDKIERFVRLAVEYGDDKPWPVTEDSWLCSPKYCPAYELCRGKFIGEHDDSRATL